MKIIKIIISVIFISLFSLTFSSAEDCSKYDKLSKVYAKCKSDNEVFFFIACVMFFFINNLIINYIGLSIIFAFTFCAGH